MIVPVLLITGTVGTGKSTVAAEINDALATLQVPNAAIDLDALVWQWPSTSKWNDDLMFENLASLWPNYQAHGATHLILARVLEDRSELARYRTAVPGAEITVCRLKTPEPLRLERLRERMRRDPHATGIWLAPSNWKASSIISRVRTSTSRTGADQYATSPVKCSSVPGGFPPKT